ncbi:MAG: ShlB/FhaC/HecB family hemolysin secretion/activation protein [Pseudomonadota bacterium]
MQGSMTGASAARRRRWSGIVAVCVRRAAALAILVAAGIAAAGPAGAQQSALQQLDDLEATIEEARPQRPAGPLPVPRASITAPPGAETVLLRLEAIELVGRDGGPLPADTRLPVEQAVPLYVDRLGTDVTLADVYDIAREIELTLKREGFVFTRVLLPRQDIQADGARIRIAVLGATIERVEVEEPDGEIGPVRDLIDAYVADLLGLVDPRVEDLERASLLITDLPGVTRATFVPSAGSGDGLIVLSVNVEREPFNAVGIVTSRDSPVIGPGIFGGIAYANTYAQYGLSTEVAYFNSWSVNDAPDLDERNTLALTQRAFLPTGTELRAFAVVSRTRPGDLVDPLDLDGSQLNVGLLVEHPFIRTRRLSLWGRGGFELVESQTDSGDTIVLTDDSLRVLFLGARGQVADPFGSTAFDAEVRRGLTILGATGEGDANTSNFFQSGSFTSFRGTVTRAQPLVGNVSMDARMVGQYSPDALLATERLQLGGSRFLKAYDPSEISGDSGFAVYGELRYDDTVTLVGRDFDYGFYGFGDYGIVFFSDTPGVQTLDRVSAGLGARLTVPEGPQLEVEVARPFGDPIARTGDNTVRVFGSLVWFF